MLLGHPSLLSSVSSVPGCNQRRPGKRQWSLWKRACRLIGDKSGKLFSSLGNWLVAGSEIRRDWKFYYDESANQLFYKDSTTTQRLRNESGWRSFNLHDWENSPMSPLAYPVSVSILDQIVQVTKCHRPYTAPIVPESFDFQEYASSHLLEWETKLFQGLTFITSPEEVHELLLLN
jgi:hypothetical protein